MMTNMTTTKGRLLFDGLVEYSGPKHSQRVFIAKQQNWASKHCGIQAGSVFLAVVTNCGKLNNGSHTHILIPKNLQCNLCIVTRTLQI